MSLSTYRKAQRLAHKEKKGGTLAVLDEHAIAASVAYREPLGVVDIPIDLIAGSMTEARASSFSPGFYPLMDESTEFAAKWAALSDAHITEGIREPIKAIEYRNRFYVIEGHKRVSVLKYFGAISIPGSVTRLVPVRTEETQVYYEFLDFYRKTGINYLLFSRPGGYTGLLKAMGKSPDAPWSADDLHSFHALFTMFRSAYLRQGGDPDELAEALIVYLDIFGFQESLRKLPNELESELLRLRPELSNRSERAGVALLTSDEVKKPLLHFAPDGLRVAFVHEETVHESAWVYSHEIGRRDLEAALGEQVETLFYDGVATGDAAMDVFAEAVGKGADVIFTTSPKLFQASVKSAVAYPQVKFLNCSLGMNYPSVRTYYARTYEAQFLLGAAAGALTPNDKINYIADCPIYGSTADINAFALGARFVNPRAEVFLEWSETSGTGSRTRLSDAGVSYIAEMDRLSPYDAQTRQAGLYRTDQRHNIAISLCRWGEIYVKIVRRMLDGSWKNDARGASAVNYWWGLDSGAVDIVLSRSVPQGTQQLISLLREALCSGRIRPFSGAIRTQGGRQLHFGSRLSPRELATMDWLVENVTGELPEIGELTDSAQELVRLQGLERGL